MNATKRAQVPFGLRKKLMAATSMLLVAAIMLVSTSYAWFTLSTAPEITGITTSVGANGNLEIALLNGLTYENTDEITSGTGDSMAAKPLTEANITWGNLVDLTGNYGLESIVLYPSALNLSNGAVGLAPLSVPEYGSDGRVEKLSANTTTGVYDAANNVFSADPTLAEYGVRAVGSADNMSARQISFKSAVSAFNSSAANVKGPTANAIGGNYSLFISMATNSDEFTYKQVQGMKTIAVNVQTSLNNIVTAYANAGLAKAASDENINDTLVGTLAQTLASETDAADLMDALNDAGVYLYDTELTNLATQQTNVAGAISAANTMLNNGAEGTTYSGTDATTIKNDIATPLLGGSQDIEIYNDQGTTFTPSGLGDAANVKEIYLVGGAAGEVAKYAGTFKAADVDIDIAELTVNVGEKGSATNKLAAVSTAVAALKAPGNTEETINITTYYGYILDFAVRTNAANSNLLLQTDAINRVYSDAEGEGLATQGNGSTLTFTVDPSSGMTVEKAKTLLQAFRLVFFNPANNGEVLKYAAVESDDITVNGNTVVARLTLHNVTTAEVTKSMLGQDAFVPQYKLDTATYPAASGTIQYTSYPDEPNAVLTKEAYDALQLGAKTSSVTDEGTGVTTYTLGKDAYVIASYAVKDGFKVTVTTTPEGGTPTETQVVASATNCWNFGTISAMQYKYLDAETAEVTKKETTVTPYTADRNIMALTQNQAHKLSVLVYMDGENIDNSSVAAEAISSGELKMNLQFASDANLKPMENSALRNMGNTETEASGGGEGA